MFFVYLQVMKKYPIFMLMVGVAVLVVMTSAAPSRKSLPAGIDLDRVKTETLNPKSAYYYPRLMEEFEDYDTTMTLEDYRHLYYGTMFREDYNPYRRSVYSDILTPLTHKSTHSRAELDTLVKYTQLALLDTPFDLNQINFLIYALRAKGKYNLADIWQYRLNNLLKAIVSTGTGQDSAGAWYILYPRDEATIVNMGKGVSVLRPTFVEPYYDCLEVTDRQGKTKSFYFNISPVLEQYNMKFPEE